MAAILPISFFLIFILDIVIWTLIFSFWLLILIIYAQFIMKKGTDPVSDKEFKQLSEFLEKQEVADYISDLVCRKSITAINKIGVEIDLKFNTNLVQKNGWDAGRFRNEKLLFKLRRLDNEVRFQRKVDEN